MGREIFFSRKWAVDDDVDSYTSEEEEGEEEEKKSYYLSLCKRYKKALS